MEQKRARPLVAAGRTQPSPTPPHRETGRQRANRSVRRGHWVDGTLTDDEARIATVAGTNPAAMTKRKVAAVAGGLVGISILRLIESRRGTSAEASVAMPPVRTACLRTT